MYTQVMLFVGGGDKGSFELISFDMFSECLNRKYKTVTALGR